MLSSSLRKGRILFPVLVGKSGLGFTPAAVNGVMQLNCSFRNLFIVSTRLKHKAERFQKRFFSTRPNWEGRGTLDDVVDFIKSEGVRKVVVMAGAGISTLSGIPDFRTPGTGLYDNLQKYDLPFPEAVFDIGFFSSNPKPFYCLAQELYPSGNYRPNVCHYFVRLLHEKGILLRMLTQNIDGLERLAGIPPKALVEAHGTFATATCRQCRKTFEGKELEESIFKAVVPLCEQCQGVIKPDIVFFGEQLPQSFHFACADMLSADLLLVLGTSLEVEPFASTAELVSKGVPRILFNKEAAGPFSTCPRSRDVIAKGDLNDTIWQFSEKLGWKDELKKLIKKNESGRKAL